MNKIDFKNKGETEVTPINADNLNLLQDNVEKAINELSNKAIYDSGSNSNGSWIRFADGSMICWKTIMGTIDITNEWGNLYSSQDISCGYFPQTFVSRPALSYSPQTQSGTQYFLVGTGGLDYGTQISAGAVGLVRPNSRTGVAYIIDVIAHGFWK